MVKCASNSCCLCLHLFISPLRSFLDRTSLLLVSCPVAVCGACVWPAQCLALWRSAECLSLMSDCHPLRSTRLQFHRLTFALCVIVVFVAVASATDRFMSFLTRVEDSSCSVVSSISCSLISCKIIARCAEMFGLASHLAASRIYCMIVVPVHVFART